MIVSGLEAEILSIQSDDDDGGVDAVVKIKDKEYALEVRQKGYPNHSGKVYDFVGGWDNKYIKEGIFLNERTIRNHHDGFIFVVEIKGCIPRYAYVTTKYIKKLLQQPHRTQRSTNSQNKQSVKLVPHNWFRYKFKEFDTHA